jgi:two-component system, OmpR family, sensor histidine kinase QseC
MTSAMFTPHTLRSLWKRLAEPTLVRRSVVSVTVAFLLVWAVLLGYNFINYKHTITNEPGLQKYGDAVLVSLKDVSEPTLAAAAMSSTDIWTNIRRREVGMLPGVSLYELRSAQGGLVFASPGWQHLPPLPQRPLDGSITETTANEQVYRIYAGRNDRWTLTIADPKRSDAAFLTRNARTLIPYLLLAAPFVLLPVWLSVRTGLRPLQQLAHLIARRDREDLQPVGFNAQHRELKPLEQSLDNLFAQLRQKVERERAFVQDAAHEIRTPLAVITAQAHVMARSQSEDERTQAQAHLEQAIARTSHLARQLLDLAALDEAQRPAPRDLDVAHWLRGTLALAAPQAMTRQIELSLDAPDTFPARLDLPALESIVHNLIDNAVRYTTAGGNVVVGLCQAGSQLQLAVQDDGPGIPTADHTLVFERFHRGAGHAATGSGLGLAIVRQAVVRMGGQVQVGEGLNGRGVGFFVGIPFAPSA